MSIWNPQTGKWEDDDLSSQIWNPQSHTWSDIKSVANGSSTKKQVQKNSNFFEKTLSSGKVGLKTIGNIATNMAEGALRAGEGMMDFSSSIADKINNPLTEKASVITGLSTKKRAKERRKKVEEGTRKFIARDLTNEYQDYTGWNDFQKEWEKDSLVKESNIGGKISQGIGGMLPSMIVGNMAGPVNSLPSVTSQGLSLGAKLLNTGKNIAKSLIVNAPANLTMGANTYGQSLQEAYQNGATNEEATKYALGSSATEIATEWITGGIPGIKSTGIVDKAANKLIDKATGKVKNEVVKEITHAILNAGYEMVGEGLEEGISEIVSPLLKNATYSKNEKVDWNNVFESVLVGGLTGGILNAPSNISNLKSNIRDVRNKNKTMLPNGLNHYLNRTQNDDTTNNPLIENTSSAVMPIALSTIGAFNNQSKITNTPFKKDNLNINNKIDASLLQNNSNYIQQTQDNDVSTNKYEYIPSNNSKIDNLRKSANQYLNKGNTSRSFIETAEKIINDKGYNIILDSNLISSNGNLVNAQIKTLENGETEIKINPNSERAGEFLLTHEITHAIETKDMVDLVVDYASKNKDFNNSLDSLKQTYGTNNVSSEVLADISGQLFGNEEFINTLSTNRPNIFKRIYNKIISIANRITGNSKESLFIRELKNKWENAYRNQNNNLNSTKYMMTGIKGVKNAIKKDSSNQFLKDNYDKANKMSSNNIDNETIRQKTGWFQDLNGDWKFEISDKDVKLVSNLAKNRTYKLGDILEHNDLYELYPELRSTTVKFKNIKNEYDKSSNISYPIAGYYVPLTKTISINNMLIDTHNFEEIENTILHEIQHRIQKKEGFDYGYKGSDIEGYKRNIGEREAKDTEKRKNLAYDERLTLSPNSMIDTNGRMDYIKNGGNHRANNKVYNKIISTTETANEGSIDAERGKGTNASKQGLDSNSSFSFDKNAKMYDDLALSKDVKFFTKENGDIKIELMDSNNNIVNDFSVYSNNTAIKYLGKEIGEYIYIYSNSDSQIISINNNTDNKDITNNYMMSHRPSEDYGNGSNFEKNMPNVFKHPEWYMDVNENYNIESVKALEKVRNNPDANITIYRATIGDAINPGDWVSPSRLYAEYHNNHQLNGKGKILKLDVKAKDILWAGDDINEFGYFPENEKYSKESGSWQKFVENNFKSKGTKSYFANMKRNDNIPTNQKLMDRKKSQIEKKYETNKNKTKKIMTKEVSRILEFSDYKTKQKFTDLVSEYYDNPNYDKIKKDIIENFSEQKIEYINEEIKEIKKTIRGTDLKVNDYIRKNITDYSFFRKENYNKLKLKNEGQSIDSFYSELSEMYPEVFSKDIINEVDQLKRLSEFMKEDSKIIEKYKIDDKVIDEATKYIYTSIKNKENIDDLVNSISISPKEIRREKTTEYREYAENFLENSDKWKDKKMGISYKINTMKRNFYDVMGKKDGERLYSNFIEPIFKHNADMQKDINSYNSKVEKLKLSDKESVAVQMLGEYKYNPETLVTGMQVDEFISHNKLDYDKISRSVDVFRNIYDDLFKRVNNVLKMQGYKELDYRKGYFPHFTEEHPTSKLGKILEKMGWNIKDNSIPTSIAGITDTFKPGKTWTSFSQQRKGKFTDYNALRGFDNYIRGAMENIYFTEDIQKLRALENEIRYQHSDSGIQNRIDEIQEDNDLTFDEKQEKIDKIFATYLTPMNNLVTEIRDYTNSIANKKSGLDRTMEQLTSRKVYSVMQNVSNRLSANMVGMNIGSAITNFIPITQAVSQVKSKYLLKGLAESIKNQYSSDDFESKSVFLTSRLNESDKLYKTTLEKISDKANFMFDAVDSITSNIIVRGKYYQNLSEGMSEYNAIRNADEFARNLMAGRTKGEMPTAFNAKNPFIKLFTSFQLEVNNQFGYMFKDLPRDLADESSKKLIGAFFKMFLGAYLYNKFTEKLVGRKSAFSPADTLREIYGTISNKKMSTTDKTSNILENVTQDVPFVGGLIGGGKLPISSVANPLNILKGESTLKDEAKKILYYTALPFGGGQLKKTIDGASMYVNKKDVKGSYTKKGSLRFEAKGDPVSIAQSLLFGQYSGKGAREYFENNYAPIDKKTLKKIKKDSISIDEYRKYQNDFESIRTKNGKSILDIRSDKKSDGKSIPGSASGKKAYLIMKSDFSVKEKNYMLSKLTNSNDYPKVNDLKKLSDNEKLYKFYYSMNDKKRKTFNSELEKYNLSVDKLYDYYSVRKKYDTEYTSSYAREKLADYIKESGFNDETKWYLYNKDYGSDTVRLLVDTFNIKFDDYLNVIKYSNKVKYEYSGTKQSKLRKQKVFNYINNLNISAKQKVVLYKQAGYSNSSSKNDMYSYINKMNLSSSEKKKIYDALY